jgi:hypothetical protein
MDRLEMFKRDSGNPDEQTTFELPLNMRLTKPAIEFPTRKSDYSLFPG